jgi:alkyl hydroperoxide reductase subunit AhpF
VLGDDDGGRVRFYGAPVGNEFPTILEGIDALSNNTPKVRQEVALAVAEHVDQPVTVKVFVTPT